MDQSETFRPDLITRRVFMVAVFLLIINDFYLKYAFSNYLTGKLSDFAGLFAFPYFFACLRVNWVKAIYITTALLFAFWKSEFSDPLLILVQSAGVGMIRTVDYSDLFALLVLPVSFLYFKEQIRKEKIWHRASTFFVCTLSMFAFWATTLASVPFDVKLDSSKKYDLPMTKQQLFQKMTPGYSYRDTLPKKLEDSLFYLRFHLPDQRARVKILAVITDHNEDTVRVELDSVLVGYLTGGLFTGVPKKKVDTFKALTIGQYEEYFKTNVIEAIKNGQGIYINYDNKLLEDSYRLNVAR